MKVVIFGSHGLVGSSLVRILDKSEKNFKIIESNRSTLDIFNKNNVEEFFKATQPDVIINAAAKVGGIYANNTKRTDFILENLKINMNLLECAIPFSDMKVINLGSSCIYPLESKNPISEESFMTGSLEPTNSPYAMAKITAIEIGRSITSQYGNKIINLMPTNLYGPNDFFSDMDSHVIPSLIHKMYNAKKNGDDLFHVWGTGNPLREFMFVDDLSKYIEYIIDKEWDHDLVNVGTGDEISIKNLAYKIKTKLNYSGNIEFDKTKPDGNPRKLLNIERLINTGWNDFTDLDSGLEKTIDWYLNNLHSSRVVTS
jgi:GDP-L-fucose synthase